MIFFLALKMKSETCFTRMGVRGGGVRYEDAAVIGKASCRSLVSGLRMSEVVHPNFFKPGAVWPTLHEKNPVLLYCNYSIVLKIC